MRQLLRDLYNEGPTAWMLTAAAIIGWFAFIAWMVKK